MRVVFMGTPDFAVASLKSIAREHDVIAVFSQPDRKSGRGKKLNKSAVKVAAESLDIPVHQYESINEDAPKALLSALKPDVVVVVAFGQILKPWLLELPKYGCLNIHASALPRWRGASPIQTAILNGDKQSGVTIIQMDKGLDTGDMLLTKYVNISDDMTGSELHDTLMPIGAEMILNALDLIQNNRIDPIEQNDDLMTYAPLITKDMMCVNWDASSVDIYNQIRAYNAWPVAFTKYQDKRLKIFKSHSIKSDKDAKNGEIIDVTDTAIVVKTGDGALSIDELQAVNSKRMSAADYLRGHKVTVGDVLG